MREERKVGRLNLPGLFEQGGRVEEEEKGVGRGRGGNGVVGRDVAAERGRSAAKEWAERMLGRNDK